MRTPVVTMDRTARVAFAGGTSLELTQLEFDVLESLVRNYGQVVSKADLTEAVYAARPEGIARPVSNVLEVIVSRLRKKLAAAGATGELVTLRARGYRLGTPL